MSHIFYFGSMEGNIPKWKIPKTAMMHPFKKAISIAISAPYVTTNGWTMVAIMAVGPIVMFSHEPKMTYINDAINAAYSPYYKT